MSYYLYVILGIQRKGICNSRRNYYLQEPQQNGRLFFTMQTTVENKMMKSTELVGWWIPNICTKVHLLIYVSKSSQMPVVKCKLTVMISIGMGVRRRSRKRELTSLTGTRTARQSSEITSSAKLVWGTFSITEARICGFKGNFWHAWFICAQIYSLILLQLLLELLN